MMLFLTVVLYLCDFGMFLTVVLYLCDFGMIWTESAKIVSTQVMIIMEIQPTKNCKKILN